MAAGERRARASGYFFSTLLAATTPFDCRVPLTSTAIAAAELAAGRVVETRARVRDDRRPRYGERDSRTRSSLTREGALQLHLAVVLVVVVVVRFVLVRFAFDPGCEH